MNTIEERLGQKIARQRRAAGLTQDQLAEKVGIQPETISRIETGTRAASLHLIASISEALGLELHDLFRLHDIDDPKNRAVDRLIWFASRLTLDEVELLMEAGAVLLAYIRRVQPR